jgi:TolB-like protein
MLNPMGIKSRNFFCSPRFFALLILFMTPALLRAFDLTLGVLYFETNAADASTSPQVRQEEREALSLALTEMIISDLSRLQVLKLVERQNLNEVIKEQSLALSGLLDDDSAVQVGRLLQARYLLTGRLIFSGSLVTLTARVVDAEEGTIAAAAARTGEASSLFLLQKELTDELVTAWDIPLSGKDRQLLSERSHVPLEGIITLGNALAAGDRGDFEEALHYLQAAVRLNPDFTLAESLRKEMEERFDRYIEGRETGLPGEIMDLIDLLAATGGDGRIEQELLKMYWAYIQPLTMANSFYISWASLDEANQQWFFENSIQGAWVQIGLPARPESILDLELYLGRKLHTAHRLLEYLLEKNLPAGGFAGYMHPVEGMTGYFLTVFSALASGSWTFPPMIDPQGTISVDSDRYPALLLRYCDMFLANFPYSPFAGTATSIM